MTSEKGIYDPVDVGELAEEVERISINVGFLAAALRQILKELPGDLDAAKLASMALPFAVYAENRSDHLLERLKNGGVL
ncbi:MAG: hypothetical protein PHW25_00515 [Zoogloea sp.]|uniref:hypothetical protein n=1 Tax=Zoogloea TaxID=349 RepID=UPI00260D76DE|nr:hypothetical protein [Zoogloea sp.]MDD3325551.1 hypothetical protein [Zoogloea sp.]